MTKYMTKIKFSARVWKINKSSVITIPQDLLKKIKPKDFVKIIMEKI